MHDSGLRHRLLAILAADGVGYSRLMAVDEQATVAALDAAREVFREQIAAHGGRLVDTAGDSVLAVFDTAGGAVGAALAVQSRLSGGPPANGDAPATPDLRFRIGVHLGDVIEKADGTVYGDGVNIAARLQALAEPGGLTVSHAVQAAVQGRVAASFEDIGPQAMKHIAQPVRACRVRAGPGAPMPRRRLAWLTRPALAAAAAVLAIAAGAGGWFAWHAQDAAPSVAGSGGGAAVGPRTIAVLPFANLGDDKANEVFADGVTDELINLLSRVRGLRVTPRASSFYFKGKSVPTAEAARLLGVDHLVDGSVRRAGDRVRIAAQLVSASDGTVLWSRSYDRGLDDMLAAQAEIALGIARSLALSLDGSAGFGGRSTTNPRAWQSFLEARRLPAGQRLAAYEAVLAIDPQFARVHAEIAEELLMMAFGGKLPKPEASERMTRHLQEALRIDPRYDHAYGLLGAAARIVDDLEALRRVAQRALEVDPDSSAGHGWMAELKLHEGDMAGALQAFKRSAESLPLVQWARVHHARALRLANRPAQALQEIEQALALDPDSASALAEKAHSLLLLGRVDEGLRLARERELPTLLIRYGTPNDQAAMRQRTNLPAHDAAWQQFLLGRPDAVAEHLEAEHADDIQARGPVLFDAEYDPVRERPSFRAWLARHKLTEAHERAQAWRAANPVQRR
jgi:adenylate cyclase